MNSVKLLYHILIFFSFFESYARKIPIPASQSHIKKNFVNPHIGPGDTLLLAEGKRDWLLFEGIQGAAGNPVVIINDEGITEITGKNINNHAVRFNLCNYIKFSGAGVHGIKNGINISYSSPGANGISIENYSDNFEVEFLEISNVGFAGIMAKTNNSGKTWTMKNMSFHDNYIHDTREGEGFYIGHSNWTLKNNQHNIDNLFIYRNHLENIAAEGIQAACTYDGNADIYNNTIINYGKSSATFASYQNNGIQLGNGFSGRCYNNLIKAGPDTLSQNALNILGVGNIFVYRNIIISPKKLGIYSGYQTAEAGKPSYFFNNIIINSGEEAIQYDPRTELNSYFHNNVLINSESKRTIDTRSGSLDTTSNKVFYDISNAIEIIENNFKIDPSLKNNFILIELEKMKTLSMDEKFLYLKESFFNSNNTGNSKGE